MAMSEAEKKLLKSLETLEKGGDALQNAPHDGGFATEGTNIQSKALKKALRGLMKGGMSKEEAEQTLKALYAKSDDASSDDESVEKGMDDDSDSMSAGDDSGSGEGGDESSDDESAEADSSSMQKSKKVNKSTGASQLANASSRHPQRAKTSDLRKALTDEDPHAGEAFDAAPILGKLIDAIDRAVKGNANGDEIAKSMKRVIRKSVAEAHEAQNAFNRKVAKGFELLFGRLDEMNDMVKSMHDQPVPNNRRTNLRKSDVVERDFGTTSRAAIDGTEEPSPLHNVEMMKIQNALCEMVMKGEADFLDVTKFENAKGNLAILPPEVVQRLEKRLCPAEAA